MSRRPSHFCALPASALIGPALDQCQPAERLESDESERRDDERVDNLELAAQEAAAGVDTQRWVLTRLDELRDEIERLA